MTKQKTTIAVVYLQGPIFVLFCSHCILVNLKGDLSQGAQRQSRGGQGALQPGERVPREGEAHRAPWAPGRQFS